MKGSDKRYKEKIFCNELKNERERNMKKVIIFLIVVALAVSMTLMGAACKAATTTTTAAETTAAATTAAATTAAATTAAETTAAKQRTIGVSLILASIPHCQAIAQAVKDVAEAKGDKVIVLDEEVKVEKEITNIEDFIAQKVDGIVLDAISFDATEAALKAAKEANIPVAAIDNMVKNQDLVISNNTSDNYMAGVLCAEDMAKKTQTGSVVILTNSTADACIQRVNGFKETLAKKAPGIKIELEAETKADIAAITTQVEDLLQRFPKLTGFFGCSDREGVGASAAFVSAGIDPKMVYSVDGNPDMIKLIIDGKAGGTVAQDPYTMGKMAIENLYLYFDGVALTAEQKSSKVPVVWIGPENAKDFDTE